MATQWRSWLGHCATSRKLAGSIPDCVNGIFHWHNPSGHTKFLQSAQILRETSTKNIRLGAMGGQLLGLTTLPPSFADCVEIWKLHPPACNSQGLSGPVQACPGIALNIYYIYIYIYLNSSLRISWTASSRHNTVSQLLLFAYARRYNKYRHTKITLKYFYQTYYVIS